MTGGLFFRAEKSIAGFAKAFHDTHGYYALTYRPAHADGEFHRIEIITRGNRPPRGPSIYWAANDEGRAAQEGSAVTEWPPQRALRRSPLIDAWAGVRVDDAGQAQMIVTWEPKSGVSARAARVLVNAKTAMGASLFEGAIEAVGRAPAADRATFKVPPGQVELDLAVLDADGRPLDSDARNLDIPDLGPASQPGPILLPVEVTCLRSNRASEVSPWSDALALYLARTCSRGGRLIVRVPIADPTRTPVRVSARLLNRAGQTMRAIEADPGGDRPTQFTLPLVSLAPGQYEIEVTGANRHGVASDRVTFRVEN
jgi:hypothetical protein